MNQPRTALFLLFTLALTTLGCSSDEDSNACALLTPSATASADGTVTYSASVQGNGSIDSLEYTSDSKPVTVKNPSLPFSVTIDVQENDPISISAVGTAANGGKVIAGYEFIDAAGSDPEQTSVECSH